MKSCTARWKVSRKNSWSARMYWTTRAKLRNRLLSTGLRVPLARRETADGLRIQHLDWGRHQAGAHSPWVGQFDLGQCAWAIFIIHIPRCRREEGQMPTSVLHTNEAADMMRRDPFR